MWNLKKTRVGSCDRSFPWSPDASPCLSGRQSSWRNSGPFTGTDSGINGTCICSGPMQDGVTSPHLEYTLRPDANTKSPQSTSPHSNLHTFLSYYHPHNVSRSPDRRYQRCHLLLTSEGSGTCILSRDDVVRLSAATPHSATSTDSLSLFHVIQFTVR